MNNVAGIEFVNRARIELVDVMHVRFVRLHEASSRSKVNVSGNLLHRQLSVHVAARVRVHQLDYALLHGVGRRQGESLGLMKGHDFFASSAALPFVFLF